MCEQKSFTTVKSTNEKFQVKVGKPKNATVNLSFNFNIFAYMGFVEILEALPYLNAQDMIDYEDGTSGMSIELTEFKALSQFIEDLPEILYCYVEKVAPTEIIRRGTKQSLAAGEKENEHC